MIFLINIPLALLWVRLVDITLPAVSATESHRAIPAFTMYGFLLGIPPWTALTKSNLLRGRFIRIYTVREVQP